VRRPQHPRRRPQGVRVLALAPHGASLMEPVRAPRPRPANGLATRNDSAGAPSFAPLRALTEPNNHMVEPETEGQSDFPVWAQQSALLHFPNSRVGLQGGLWPPVSSGQDSPAV